jgi:cardiolipin synthase
LFTLFTRHLKTRRGSAMICGAWTCGSGLSAADRTMRGSDEVRRLEDRIFTLPNALSLVRLFMVPIVVALLLVRADRLAAAFFVLAAVTDFLDGRLARRAGPTRLGQILDPLADRLMLSSVAVVLAVRGLLPAWVVAILVGRDLLTLIGSIVVGSKVRVNRVGKAATAVLMGAIALVVLKPGTLVGDIMFYTGFGLSIVAGLMYLRSIRRVLGGGGVR